MKYSTAKHIFANYKKTGNIERKQSSFEFDTARDQFLLQLGKEILTFKKDPVQPENPKNRH